MDVYQELAAEVRSGCPGGSIETMLLAELDAGYSDFTVSCVGEDGHVQSGDVSDEASWRIHQLLTQLQAEFRDKTGHAWRKCTFTVFPSGKFKFDVEY